MRLKKSAISAIIILVALITIISLSGLNFLTPQTNTDGQYESVLDSYELKSMFLTTKDNTKIAADLYQADNPSRWLALVHMMPATKESWQDFAKEIQSRGYESIAIDLRGHGESDGGPDGFTKFSDAEHQKSIMDLEASIDYLIKNRGASPDKISFVGASIGANLTLQYITENQEYKTAILLSPGLNYRGIEAEPLVRKLKSGQRVFFVSAKDDDNNSKQVQKLYDLTPAGVEEKIQIYEFGGHGTDILENQSDLMNLIADFIK